MLLLLGMLGSFPNYGVTAFATSPSVPGVTQSRNITLKGTIIDETGETVPDDSPDYRIREVEVWTKIFILRI